MKHQRQAGFIRNYSSKQLPTFTPEPSQFSYFRHRPLNDQKDQFSPYKMQQELVKNILPKRPPLPQPKSRQGKQQVELKAQGQKIYTKLKERMNNYQQTKEKSKEKLQTNISSVRNKIEQIENAIKQLKVSGQRKRKVQTIQQKFEADPSSSSSYSSQQSEQIVVKSIPSPKMSIQKKYQAQKMMKTSHSRQEQSKRNSRQGTISNNRENIITFNSRVSNHPPLQIKNYSSSSEEEELQIRQIKTNQIAFHQKEQSGQQKKQRGVVKKDVFKNKGGICFDVDTKQFAQPVILPREDYHPKKAVKTDKRAQIIRRRETAKAYDKMARKAVFTSYH